MNRQAEVGQTWASTHPQDVQRGWNQRRRVLALTTRQRGDSEVPAAVLSCDGNGGKMRSRLMLAPDGSIPRHRLVAEADPRIDQLAETLRGIQTRDPYDRWTDGHGYVKTRDLADEVRTALLRPRQADGSQNPRIEVVLHPDALLAITERIAELVEVIEQNAMAAQINDFQS